MFSGVNYKKMILDYDFSTDETNKEKIPAAENFPFVIKYTAFSKLVGGFAHWHWHDFFEITIPHQDRMIFQSPDHSETIRLGEAVFVNSSTLHTVSWDGDSSDKSTYTFFFDRSILSGNYGSVFDEKYVSPISMCRDLEFFVLRPTHKEGLRALTLLGDIVDLFKKESFGYELAARSALSEFWILLLSETSHFRENARSIDPTDNMRMKQMMNYIHEHFSEKIYLEDIASTAGISTRECSRCFKRQISQSPMDYLNQYRIRVAAELLKSTRKPVSLIGEECGFSSDSYFGRTFKQYMAQSPRDYRRKAL